MRRVLVIGSPGAGKSTLACRIGAILDLPVIHLDTLYWNPGWVASSNERMLARISDALDGARWIIDGNFSETLDMRIRAADTIIFLDLPRRLCMWRIIARWWQYLGRTRPDLPNGCPEQLDFEFLEWVWEFPEHVRPKVLDILKKYVNAKTIILLRSPIEVERFVKQLEPSCG